MTVENVIIIGSGPAGLTAALYTARANLEPLVFTGNEIGGQVSITNEVENYPGFPEGLTGPELVEKFQKQAERFGARVEYAEVSQVDLDVQPFRVRSYDSEHEAKAIIVATGASARKLGVPGEVDFTGRGVSYCATCDGFFFRNKDVVVIGGGDSALEEGVFLTKFASRVRIIHRRDQLRAGFALQERAKRNEKIEFVWDTIVTEINGNGEVESVQVENVKTGEVATLNTEGVFVYIWHYPNSQLFKGVLDMDEHGYLTTDRLTRTSLPGVFAAGEITDSVFRQVVTSAGEGCKAAIQVERYLAELEDRAYPGHQ
jgi:thioredoxin reductase (NADPH)